MNLLTIAFDTWYVVSLLWLLAPLAGIAAGILWLPGEWLLMHSFAGIRRYKRYRRSRCHS